MSCFLLWWFSSVRVLLCQQHLILNSKSAHFEVGWWFLHRFCVIYAGAVPAPPRLRWRDDYNDNMLRHTIAAQPTASCSTALKYYEASELTSQLVSPCVHHPRQVLLGVGLPLIVSKMLEIEYLKTSMSCSALWQKYCWFKEVREETDRRANKIWRCLQWSGRCQNISTTDHPSIIQYKYQHSTFPAHLELGQGILKSRLDSSGRYFIR